VPWLGLAVLAAYAYLLFSGWGRGGSDMTLDWIVDADPRPGI